MCMLADISISFLIFEFLFSSSFTKLVGKKCLNFLSVYMNLRPCVLTCGVVFVKLALIIIKLGKQIQITARVLRTSTSKVLKSVKRCLYISKIFVSSGVR